MPGEREFLRNYDATVYTRPNCTVDMAIFTVREGALRVLTVKRNAHPFLGEWSLVGGFIDTAQDSTLEDTAMRKLREKTGVAAPYLEQFGTVGNNTRDPRGWTVTTVYFALIASDAVTLLPGEDIGDIRWMDVSDSGIRTKLAFDHDVLLAGCLRRLRDKVLYTSLPVHLMPENFTLGELQRTYEVILGEPTDHKSFRRRILSADIVEETGCMKHEAKRPAKTYRLKKSAGTHYFLRTLEGAVR